MDISKFMSQKGEKPLDNLVDDGGFCKIFRRIACIGDSLASGEFETKCDKCGSGYHDFYEYSWGQYMARQAGIEVLNFSRGGMTANEYMDSFSGINHLWDRDKLCQAYIIALGVNDILNQGQPVGTIDDISLDNKYENKATFAGNYGKIIQKLKCNQPDAKFFIMTIPRDDAKEQNTLREEHAKLLYDIADFFDNTYVLDFYKYAPVYDKEFRRHFFLKGHMNPAGYALTAKMVMSYIDYIVRNNPEDFAQAGFIGTPYYSKEL